MTDGRARPDPLTAPFPQKVGRYELLLPLGTGGMATVFLARARGAGGFERDVALKLLHAHLREDEESKMHLLEEAKLAVRIRHPNVVSVLEIDEDPFGLYLVMEYVEGETLSGLLQAARTAGVEVPLRIAARVLDDSLAGLQAAHELRSEAGAPLGLVHRDFSPQNILVATDGRAKLTDFGIAKAAGRAVRTKTGLVKGKVAYMSPEQARGHDVDRRCDVWAAGVVAWELVAGRRLHNKTDDVATLLAVVTEEPPLLSTAVEDVSAVLEATVAAALTSDLERRCASAADLRRRLEAAWAETGGMATHEEVSELVRRVVGPRLVKRGAQIAELRELRSRRGDVPAPDAVTELTMTAPGSGRRPRDPELPAEAAPARLPDTVVTPASDASSSAQAVATGTRSAVTEASTILARLEERRTRRRNVASGIFAGVTIAALVGVVVTRTGAPRTGRDTAAAEPVRKAASQAIPVVPPQPPATATTVAPAEPPPAEEPAAEEAPSRSAPPTHRAPVSSLAKRAGVQNGERAPHPESVDAPRRAPPRSTAPKKLASDPYGGS